MVVLFISGCLGVVQLNLSQYMRIFAKQLKCSLDLLGFKLKMMLLWYFRVFSHFDWSTTREFIYLESVRGNRFNRMTVGTEVVPPTFFFGERGTMVDCWKKASESTINTYVFCTWGHWNLGETHMLGHLSIGLFIKFIKHWSAQRKTGCTKPAQAPKSNQQSSHFNKSFLLNSSGNCFLSAG